MEHGASRIPNTGYYANLSAGHDLGPVLEAANLRPEQGYYALISAAGQTFRPDFSVAAVAPPATAFVPAVYTPGSAFVLQRDADGLQFMTAGGRPVAGTPHFDAPRSGIDLGPVLDAAAPPAGNDYYVLIKTGPYYLRPPLTVRAAGGETPFDPRTVIPATYTPGQAFALRRAVTSLTLMDASGTRIPGTTDRSALAAGFDLGPVLDAAKPPAGMGFYALVRLPGSDTFRRPTFEVKAAITPKPPEVPGQIVPATYTPGQPFRLLRRVDALQILRHGTSGRVPGTDYRIDQASGTDLGPMLDAARPAAGTNYYVLVQNGALTDRQDFTIEAAPPVPPGPGDDSDFTGWRIDPDPTVDRTPVALSAPTANIQSIRESARTQVNLSGTLTHTAITDALGNGGVTLKIGAGSVYTGPEILLPDNTVIECDGPGLRPEFRFTTVRGFSVNSATRPGYSNWYTQARSNIMLRGLIIKSETGITNTQKGYEFKYNGQGGNVALIDCDITEFSDGVVLKGAFDDRSLHPYQPGVQASGFLFERCFFYENAFKHGHGQGFFAEAISGLVVRGCWFDRNGWSPSNGIPKTKFDHNVYVNYLCTEATFENCGFTRAASHAAQLRGGGNFVGSYVDYCPMGVAMMDRKCFFSKNVVARSNNIDDTQIDKHGAGLEFRFTRNARVVDSIFNKKIGGGIYGAVQTGENPFRETAREVPEQIAADGQPIGSRVEVENLRVRLWKHTEPGQRNPVLYNGGNRSTFIEHEMEIDRTDWVSPDRFLENYLQSLGQAAITKAEAAFDYVRNVLTQRSVGTWPQELTATAVNNWIGNGFRRQSGTGGGPDDQTTDRTRNPVIRFDSGHQLRTDKQGKPVVIHLLGFGGNAARRGTWYSGSETDPDPSDPHTFPREFFYSYSDNGLGEGAEHHLFQLEDVFSENRGAVPTLNGEYDKNRLREFFTWWTGSRPAPGSPVRLHTLNNVLAFARWVRTTLQPSRVILRGDSGGGGGAIFAALEAPDLFDAVVAAVPWTNFNDATDPEDGTAAVSSVSRTHFSAPNVGPRMDRETLVTGGKRMGEIFDAAARLALKETRFPPLVMVSGKSDRSMVFANDRRLIETLKFTERTFAALWNNGDHDTAYKTIGSTELKSMQANLVKGQFGQVFGRNSDPLTALDQREGLIVNRSPA